MRDDAPSTRRINVNVQNAKLAAELAALDGASFRAQAENGSDVAINFHLNIRAMNEAVCIGGSLNELDLFGFIDDFTIVRDAGKIIRENRVENGGIVELDGVGEALLEIGDCLTVGFLIGL